MRYLLSFLFVVQVFSGKTQYDFEISDDTTYLIHNGNKELVKLHPDPDYDWLYVFENNQGRFTICSELELDTVYWFDNNPLLNDRPIDGMPFYDEYVPIMVERKIGIYSFGSNRFVLKPSDLVDSVVWNLDSEGYGDYHFGIYSKGQLAIIPESGTNMLAQDLIFAEQFYRDESYFEYPDYNNDLRIYVKNKKYGIYEYEYHWADKDSTVRQDRQRQILSCIYDTIYQVEETYVAQKGGEFLVFNINSKELIDDAPQYSAIYYNGYDIVKVPSAKTFAEIYPEVIEVTPMEQSMGELVLFRSEHGYGVYSSKKDELLFPMKYEEVVYLKSNDLLRFKRGEYYAYAAPSYYDYEFTGYTKDLNFIYKDSSLDEAYQNGVSKTYFQGDTIYLKGYPGKCYVCATHNCESIEYLDDIIQSEESSTSALNKMLDRRNAMYLKKLSVERYLDDQDKAHITFFEDNKGAEISVLHHSNSLLDSVENVFKDDYRKFHQVYVMVKNQRYVSESDAYYYSGNWKCWNDTMIVSFLVDGKRQKFHQLQTSEFGHYVLTNKKGKGVLYNKDHEKCFKLKPNELLVDAQQGHFIIENWKRGDTLAKYSMVDSQKNEIVHFVKRVDTENKGWTNKAPLRIVKDREGLTTNYSGGIELPVSFYDYNTRSYIVMNDNHRSTALYDLNGQELPIELSGSKGEFLELKSKTPRADLKGLHDGYDWIVKPEYEEIERFTLNTRSGSWEPIYRVSFKNIYGLVAEDGGVILESAYYEIEPEYIEGDRALLRVVPVSSGKFERIYVELKPKDQ